MKYLDMVETHFSIELRNLNVQILLICQLIDSPIRKRNLDHVNARIAQLTARFEVIEREVIQEIETLRELKLTLSAEILKKISATIRHKTTGPVVEVILRVVKQANLRLAAEISVQENRKLSDANERLSAMRKKLGQTRSLNTALHC